MGARGALLVLGVCEAGALCAYVCSPRSILTFCISNLFYCFNFSLVAKWSGFGQELQNVAMCMCSIAGLPSLLKT